MSTEFTQGKILKPLMKFTVPIMIALILQALYGAVDLLVVGQFASPEAVAAVATGSQIMHTMMVVITGLSMGITVLIGQQFGRGEPEKVGDTVGSGIFLFAVLSLILTAVMTASVPALVSLMQTPEAAVQYTRDYVLICAAGILFIAAYNTLGSIFRGLGDSRTPLLAVAIACVSNIALDLLLVAGFHMGSGGAALATVIAQALSVALSLWVVSRRGLPFPFTWRQIRFHRLYLTEILKLGTPVALQDLLVSISFLAITAIVNQLGVIASAGVGVAEKLCTFILLVPSAYAQSISAYVAQNVGAGQPQRARRGMACGMGTSLIFGLFMSYFAFFHGDLLAGVFAKDAAVIAAAADYLKAYAIDTLLVSFMFCFVGYFNGCGKTTFVMLQGLVGAFFVRIPVSFLASRAAEVTLFKIGLATPSSTFVQIVLCVLYFSYLNRKEKRRPLAAASH